MAHKQYFVFFGRSFKFIDNFSEYFGSDAIEVIPWRNGNDGPPLIIQKYNATLIICGFNHEVYRLGYIGFVEFNIRQPYKFLCAEINKFKEIIYIDTMSTKSLNTGSFYFYAKKELKRKLLLIRGDIRIVELPMVVNNFGWPDLHASFIEKLLACIVLKVKKIKTVQVNEIVAYIIENNRIATHWDYYEYKIFYRNLYRNRLIDKIIRVIYG